MKWTGLGANAGKGSNAYGGVAAGYLGYFNPSLTVKNAGKPLELPSFE
jgi:hypothetical protein